MPRPSSAGQPSLRSAVTTQIGRDATGRIAHYLEWGLDGGYYERRGATEGDWIVYDRAGRALGETSFSGRSDGVYKTVLTNTYTAGQLTSQTQQRSQRRRYGRGRHVSELYLSMVGRRDPVGDLGRCRALYREDRFRCSTD